MKHSTPFFLLFVVTFMSSPGVTAESVMRYLFNNGAVNKDLICDATDWAKIDPIFENAAPNRRNLRQANKVNTKRKLDFEMDIVDHYKEKERELYTAAQCRNMCAGQMEGTYCRATGCTWYLVRRNLARNMSERDLQVAWCTDTALSINTQLDNLVLNQQVSISCQQLLSAPRKIECLNDIVFGEVEQFNIWNADTDKMIASAVNNGHVFCARSKIDVEVQTNPCVKYVQTQLTGPNGLFLSNYEGTAPYTIFGNSGKNMYGRILLPGNYTITAIPDGIKTKTKELKFTVTAC